VSGDWSNVVTLTRNDFIQAGIDINNRQGIIIIEAQALYDYSYGMMDDFEEYRDNFLDTSVRNYNRMPLNVLQLTSAGVVTGTLNRATINLGEKPPYLFNPADSAVTVTTLANVGSNASGYTDPLLDRNTDIGMKVQSNYPNENGDTVSITYYCMTMDGFSGFSARDGDIVLAYRQQDPAAMDAVKFDVTLDLSKYQLSGKGVPPLYVVITDDERLLNNCRTAVEGGYTYHPDESMAYHLCNVDAGISCIYSGVPEIGYPFDSLGTGHYSIGRNSCLLVWSRRGWLQSKFPANTIRKVHISLLDQPDLGQSQIGF